MANIIDITGIIQEGMWNYEPPFPEIKIKPLPQVPWVDKSVFCEIFEGMHSQTGTYLETPAHYFGNDKSYLLIDVPVEKLYNIDCVVLHLEPGKMENNIEKRPITVEDLENSKNAGFIKEGDAVLVCTGWDMYWMDDIYLKHSPYFTYDAMMWLIEKKPFILGSDFARWDNLQKSEEFFQKFYEANILMLAPCVNLNRVTKPRVKLTALPLKICGTSCAPCRAVIIEE
ncbi:MAG TPA: cyclase family protein [Clostridiaceae bacterium]|nr:cyclase family protein [Clostridiaceae bacterium]